MLACERDAHEVVDALLGGGASPTQGLHNGWNVVLTPLKLACIGGHHRCVGSLLAARARIDDDDGSRCDVVEADGSTMLIYAAQRTHKRTPTAGDGHAETVRLLLEAHAQVDQSRWDGITPLSALLSRWIACTLARLPSCTGSVPLSALCARSRYVRFVRSPRKSTLCSGPCEMRRGGARTTTARPGRTLC